MGFWDRFKPGRVTPNPEVPTIKDAAPQPPKDDYVEMLAKQLDGNDMLNPDRRIILEGPANVETLKSLEVSRRARLGERIRERIDDYTESLDVFRQELGRWNAMSDRDVADQISDSTISGALQSIESFRSTRVVNAANNLRHTERIILALDILSEALESSGNDPQAAMKEIDQQAASVIEALQEAQRLNKPENVQQALWGKHARLRAAGDALRTEYNSIWHLP